MHVICTAVVEDDRQRANLAQCTEILGGKPQISGDTVCVDYEGPDKTGERLVDLYEQFSFHVVNRIS